MVAKMSFCELMILKGASVTGMVIKGSKLWVKVKMKGGSCWKVVLCIYNRVKGRLCPILLFVC